MKKKFILILISFILIINLLGCDLKKEQQQNNKILTYEEIDDFAAKNQIKILGSEEKDDGYIITYEKENEYGIMKLYHDESLNEIMYIEDNINISQANEILLTQISHDKENYIGLFINNEDLKQRAEDISVDLKIMILQISHL